MKQYFRLEGQCLRQPTAVDLAGVPQIPDDLARLMNRGLEARMTADDQRRCDDAIAAACQVIHERLIAKKVRTPQHAASDPPPHQSPDYRPLGDYAVYIEG